MVALVCPCQCQIGCRRLPRLLHKSMQHDKPLQSVHIKEQPRCPIAAEIAPQLMQTSPHWPAQRQANGPAKFNSLKRLANRAPILGSHETEPVSYRLIPRLRSIEDRGNSLHDMTDQTTRNTAKQECTICGTSKRKCDLHTRKLPGDTGGRYGPDCAQPLILLEFMTLPFTPTPRAYVLIGVAIIAASAVTLLALGQPPICTCGVVRLWQADVMSAENSQQLSDWYSPSHFIHGLLVLWADVAVVPAPALRPSRHRRPDHRMRLGGPGKHADDDRPLPRGDDRAGL